MTMSTFALFSSLFKLSNPNLWVGSQKMLLLRSLMTSSVFANCFSNRCRPFNLININFQYMFRITNFRKLKNYSIFKIHNNGNPRYSIVFNFLNHNDKNPTLEIVEMETWHSITPFFRSVHLLDTLCTMESSSLADPGFNGWSY